MGLSSSERAARSRQRDRSAAAYVGWASSMRWRRPARSKPGGPGGRAALVHTSSAAGSSGRRSDSASRASSRPRSKSEVPSDQRMDSEASRMMTVAAGPLTTSAAAASGRSSGMASAMGSASRMRVRSA